MAVLLVFCALDKMDIIANILPEEEVSWMAEKKINHNNRFFLTIGSAFVFFFFFALKISRTLSPSFSWWKSMSWIHDRKKDPEKQQKRKYFRYKI